MASSLEYEAGPTPFMRSLVSSDAKARSQSLDSLRTYLLSGRPFTHLELLRVWKALFFSMWHCDRPKPQRQLVLSLSHLLLDVPAPIFIPFSQAFWITMAREWTSIDRLRMDKFMALVRGYVWAGFERLGRGGWKETEVRDYESLIRGKDGSEDKENKEEGNSPGPRGKVGPLMVEGKRVGDGLRYHVLDVWVDELSKVGLLGDDIKSGWKGNVPVEELTKPIRLLARDGKTKQVRERAREVLSDERLQGRGGDWKSGREKSENETSDVTKIVEDDE